MKRFIAVFLLFVCTSLLFAGTAFAKAPDAASYFTHSGYNKTYTDGDGLSHTMTVTGIGETWNKLGTVIYSINYEDVYHNDGNTYIDVMSATEIYENARQTYPDSQQHSVYQVKWYADGRKEIVSDYRPAVPEETTLPTQTAPPKETPAATPSPSPSTPSPTPSAPPVATDKAVSTPAESTRPKPTTNTPTTQENSPAPDSPTSSEEVIALTPDPIPSQTEPETALTGESTVLSTSTPAPEDEPERVPQGAGASRWVWPVIILLGIGLAILLAFYLEGKRGKEENDHEDHEA